MYAHVGEIVPKRDQLEWPCSVVKKDIYDLLDSKDECDFLDLVLYLYVGMDWRGCVNIQFTKDEPPNGRGVIIVMF